VRQDRESNPQSRYPHGGVLIFVRKDIEYKRVQFANTDFIESVYIQISTGSFSLTVGSVYCASTLSQKQFKSDALKLLSQRGSFILAGDWNAKNSSWNNSHGNPKGTALKSLCDEKRIDFHFPDFPTLTPDCNKGQPSIVDFVLSKDVFDIDKPETIMELSSDHRPIAFSIGANLSYPETRKIRAYSRADWKRFRSEIDSHEIPQMSDNRLSIDEEIREINSIIREATEASIPLKKPPHFRYPYSQEIERLIRRRNAFRKQAKLTNNHVLRSWVNQLNRQIKSLTAEMQKDNWNEKLSTLRTDDLSLWQFTGKIKRKSFGLPPLKDPLDELVYSDQEKSELIANAFYQSHVIDSAPTVHSESVANSKRLLHSLPIDFPVIQRVRPNQLRELIDGLKTRKACGYDNINNRLVKNLPTSMIERISSLFTSCLKIGYFPDSWKVGKVIALPKPDKERSIPSNYRPITLLSVFAKLFEKSILNLMLDHEINHKILIDQQFGFRSNHSTTQQLMRIVEFITIRFNESKSTGMVLLDIEKAFDSVWHDALLHKLMVAGVPTHLVKIVQSFLENRSSFVVINDKKSRAYNVPAGVPQGSPLSPHLFNIFHNDIPIPKGCKVSVFADDTALSASARNHDLKSITDTLSAGVDETNKHFKDWKVKANVLKTEAILFTKSPKMKELAETFKIKFEGASLEWKDSVKYLGVILDSKLLFKQNVEYNVKKARKAVAILYCLLKRSSHVRREEKITLYRSYIRPILTYACPVMAHIAKCHLKKLQIQQNRTLRMVLKAHRRTRIELLHKRTGIPLMSDFMSKINKKFYENCEKSDNKLIKRLGTAQRSAALAKVKHRIPKRLNN